MKYLTLLLIVVSPFLYAQEQRLKAVTEHFPPFSFVQDESYGGFSVAFFQHVAQRLDMRLELQILPWARAYHIASNEPNVLIFSMARTPERENQFIWLSPFGRNEVSFYANKSDTYPDNIDFSSLKNKRVGAIRDSLVAHQLSANNQFIATNALIEVENMQQLIGLLKRKRVDIVSLSDAMLHEVAKDDLALLQHLFIYQSFVLYGAFHPDSDPALVNTVREQMDTFIGSDQYQALLNEYFPHKQAYAVTVYP